MKGKGTTFNVEDIQLDVVDIDRECPNFKHALTRQDGHFLMEEIDQIRVDLEILLSTSISRIKSLQEDLEICESGGIIISKSPTKGKSVPPKGKTSRQSELSETSPMKKRSKIARQQISSSLTSISKSRSGKGEANNGGATTPSLETARLLHSKSVDKFWSSVEPFCEPVTLSLVKELEALKDGFNKTDTTDFKKSLGNKQGSIRSSSTTTATGQRTKNQSANLGPLTRRLVSALLEDSFAADSSNDQFSTSTVGDGMSSPPPSSMALARALDLGNTVALERRVKRILEKNDIFDNTDSESSDSESDFHQNGHTISRVKRPQDEVSEELLRCQEELKAISDGNQVNLVDLINTAKSAMQLTSLRSQLDNLENEIEESYQKVVTSKRKKATNVAKKERDTFYRLLIEWRKIALQIEQLS